MVYTSALQKLWMFRNCGNLAKVVGKTIIHVWGG